MASHQLIASKKTLSGNLIVLRWLKSEIERPENDKTEDLYGTIPLSSEVANWRLSKLSIFEAGRSKRVQTFIRLQAYTYAFECINWNVWYYNSNIRYASLKSLPSPVILRKYER